MGIATDIFSQARQAPPPGFRWDVIYPDGIVHARQVSPGLPVFLYDGPNGEPRQAASLIRFIEMRRIADDLCEPAPRGFGIWCAVIAVRDGAAAIQRDVSVWAYNPRDPSDAARHAHGLAPGWIQRINPAIWGEDIIDLVAMRLSFRGSALRLTGLASHLGPQNPSDDAPLRVHRSVASWLASECDGIVPLGNDSERQGTLLRLGQSGLVVDNVLHGTEIERLLRRPAPPTPAIYVRQAEAA